MPTSQVSKANTSSEDNSSMSSKMSSAKSTTSQTGKTKPSYKHVPHSQKPAHLVAKRNARERRRVQAVNQAFYNLRKCVPIENRNKRVSKVKTLQRAIDYIRKLERILAEDDDANAHQPVVSSTGSPLTIGQLASETSHVLQLTDSSLAKTVDNCDRSARAKQKTPANKRAVEGAQTKKRGRKPNANPNSNPNPNLNPNPNPNPNSKSSLPEHIVSSFEGQPDLMAAKYTPGTQLDSYPQCSQVNHTYMMQCSNLPSAPIYSSPVSESVLRESSVCNISSQQQQYGQYNGSHNQHQDYHSSAYLNGSSGYSTSTDYLSCDERGSSFHSSGSDIAPNYATGYSFYQPMGGYDQPPYNANHQEIDQHNWQPNVNMLPVAKQQPADSSSGSLDASPSRSQSQSQANSGTGDNSSPVVCGPARADCSAASPTTNRTPASALTSSPTISGCLAQQQQQQQQQQQVNSGYSAYAPTAHLSIGAGPPFAVNGASNDAYLSATKSSDTTTSSVRRTDGIANKTPVGKPNNGSLAAQVTCTSHHQQHSNNNNNHHHHHHHHHHHQVRHLLDGASLSANNLHEQRQLQYHHNQSSSSAAAAAAATATVAAVESPFSLLNNQNDSSASADEMLTRAAATVSGGPSSAGIERSLIVQHKACFGAGVIQQPARR